jgi:hypothetical protein
MIGKDATGSLKKRPASETSTSTKREAPKSRKAKKDVSTTETSTPDEALNTINVGMPKELPKSTAKKDLATKLPPTPEEYLRTINVEGQKGLPGSKQSKDIAKRETLTPDEYLRTINVEGQKELPGGTGTKGREFTKGKTKGPKADEPEGTYREMPEFGTELPGGATKKPKKDKKITFKDTELKSAYDKAQRYYAKEVVPLKDKTLKSVRKEDSKADEIYRKFITADKGSGEGSRAKDFYNSLDEGGQSAVRYGMVKNAIEGAKSTKGGEDYINPTKFAKSISKISEAKDQFFTGKAKKEVDGLVKLMEHSSRFGKYMDDTSGGDNLFRIGAIGGAIGGGYLDPVKAGMAASAMYIANKMLTTKAGRNFLLAANTLEPGSKRMQMLMDRIRDHGTLFTVSARTKGKDDKADK